MKFENSQDTINYRKKYRISALQFATIIYLIIDICTRITYVSEALCEISGFTQEELLGKQHNILRHPDMPSKVFEDLWNVIKEGKTWRGEIKNRKKSGTPSRVHVTISPHYDQNKLIG